MRKKIYRFLNQLQCSITGHDKNLKWNPQNGDKHSCVYCGAHYVYKK